jgi:predicted Zn finger-like uncharacterized protein
MRENEGTQTPEPRPHAAMTVYCPHCSTGYLLPDHLIGRHGTRVRCPECQGAFAVAAGSDVRLVGDVYPLAPPSARSVPAAPAPPSPAEDAAAVIDELVAVLGDALVGARARGKVLSEHGPAIVDAYHEYRRRAGVRGAPGLFRIALRERCGVDLIGRNGA